eukprot:6718809-Alexandrium_andersonii.AAC.1
MDAQTQLTAGIVGARAPRGGHQHPAPQDFPSGRVGPAAPRPHTGPQFGNAAGQNRLPGRGGAG